MKRLLVAGASGMLGADTVREFLQDFEVTGLSRQELDITDKASVAYAFQVYKPEIVINCAAFTRVDDCESMEEVALAVNAEGPGNLAAECRRTGCLIVHISTDYVFDGRNRVPWKEDDPVSPLNVYGESKLQGEIRVREECPDHLIVRTSWLFGRNGPNFIRTMLDLARHNKELSVVNDQVGSPTYTKDLARGIRALIARDLKGVFHCCNSGSCTWFELCSFVFERQAIDDVTLKPVSSRAFPRPAARPGYSVLDTGNFQRSTGMVMRPWKQAVADFLQELDNNPGTQGPA